jgi:hypothetical protein
MFSVPVPGDDGRYDSTTRYALGMGVVAADLKMIPNQPVHCDVSTGSHMHHTCVLLLERHLNVSGSCDSWKSAHKVLF